MTCLMFGRLSEKSDANLSLYLFYFCNFNPFVKLAGTLWLAAKSRVLKVKHSNFGSELPPHHNHRHDNIRSFTAECIVRCQRISGDILRSWVCFQNKNVHVYTISMNKVNPKSILYAYAGESVNNVTVSQWFSREHEACSALNDSWKIKEEESSKNVWDRKLWK